MGLNKKLITRLATDYLSRVFTRGLGRTLFIRFLVVAIVPMVFVGAISVQQMVQSFNLSRTEGLAAVARAKHSDLSHYFDFTLTNIRVQAELENTVNFLLALKSARASSDQSLAKFHHSFQWASMEDQYGSDLSHFLTNYSYIDLLLLDEQGNVLYSIRRDDDLGNNLFTGDYSASRFAAAAKEALQTGAAIYSDMEHYPPFNIQISG
ncbi:MAG: hypothetical protein MJK13_08025, partial [Pseudomonadales bacterium]|nr:hypothetical protein [Pseudomonadales bacterium]